MKKSYYAIIPADVRYDKDLPMGARMLYGELTALANEKGYCWAQNSYFAELYEVSKTTISNWITSLEEKGYIHREMIYKENSKEIRERRIYIKPIQENLDTPIKENLDTPLKNFKEPIQENLSTPIKENFKDNNTLFNNTINNTEEYILSPSSNSDDDINQLSEKDKDANRIEKVPYQKIVDAYNDICVSMPSVKAVTSKRKEKMKVLFREVQDLDVIEECFRKAEKSSFLNGSSGKWSGCNFDWLVNYNNFIKVLEGTYDDKEVVKKRKEIDYEAAARNSKYGF